MNRYSDAIMEHFCEPHNRGTLESPSGVGLSGQIGAGPFIVFQVVCDNGVIKQAAFQCHTCGVTVACGSMLTILILQKTIEDCLRVTAQDLSEALGGVPIDKQHVPEFVIRAMHQAVEEANT